MRSSALAALVALALLAACGGAPRRSSAPPGERPRAGIYQLGKATWYGGKNGGDSTASGEPVDAHALTAAHKSLPFGTLVRVVSHINRKSVVVRITDRGPYGKGRIIDLTFAGASALDMIHAGVIPVHLEIVKWGDGKRKRRR